MYFALKLNPVAPSSSCPIAPNSVIHLDFSNYQPHNTNCKYLQTITRLIHDKTFFQPANDNTNIIKIATRTLGTITDILGAGSSLRITYIDPSNRLIKFFPWLCMLLTLLMLASFRPLGPPQMPLSPLRGPLPILVRGEFNLAPIWGEDIRLALEGRDRSLHSKGRERVIFRLLTLWHH